MLTSGNRLPKYVLRKHDLVRRDLIRLNKPCETVRLIEQLELELEELVATASEDELAAQAAAAKAQKVRAFTRKRAVRKPWPDDTEHERVVIEPPTTCACCGGSRLAKIGEV